MDSNIAIEVKDVTKKFKLYYDKGHMLKERAISWKRNKYEEREVLKGISFQVKKGEAVGLIGHNGCGKSTTLKLLTKIMYPDSGTIELSGRVSSLLELGAGFHPDLSGRENIYINASIFGLTKKEIDKRLKDIIDFSELEEFIDNPVRTYSSGMYMRLAFAVAINVDAEILLIDEILAVGDVNFQAKCFNKLMEIKENGTTIVLVSHSTNQVESVCDRAIWIHDGVVKAEGKTKDVNQAYLSFMDQKRKNESEEAFNESTDMCESHQDVANADSEDLGKRFGTGEAKFVSVVSTNTDGKKQFTFNQGESIEFILEYKVNSPINDCYFGLSIFRNDNVRCYGTNTYVDGINLYNLTENGKIAIKFNNIQLIKGQYYIDICIANKGGLFIDYWSGINKFEVFSNKEDIGTVRLEHSWR